MNAFFRKLSWLRRSPKQGDELREELQFHLEEEAEERQAQGWRTKKRAGRTPRFGNVT